MDEAVRVLTGWLEHGLLSSRCDRWLTLGPVQSAIITMDG